MTTRHRGYVVVLERDIREDDAAATIAALKRIRGVLTVKAVETTPEAMIAESRAWADVQRRVYKALDPGEGA